MSNIGNEEGMRGFLAVIVDQQVNHFKDFARLIGSAVYILYILWFCQFLGC